MTEKRKISMLVLSTLLAGSFMSANAATNQTNYWRLNFPSSTQYPVYIYNTANKQLVDYVENSAQPVFLGKTTSDNNYQLVSQSNGSYVGCTLSLNNNAVSGSCPGLTKQVLKVNEQIIVYGAEALPSITPVVTPAVPSYAKRSITFNNKLDKPITLLVTGGGKSKTIGIAKNSSHIYDIPKAGLTSYNFQVKEIDGKNVSNGKDGDYATLLEVTYPSLTDATKQANVDVSMVNGFNISYKFYPKDGAYFTRDFSKKEVLQAVDYFDKNSPASTFMPKDFGDLCSTIDTGMHKQQAEFALGDFTIKSDKEVLGCYSPRTVAGFKFGTSSTLYQQYGCTGDYNNPSKCTVAANSAYVKAIHENAYRGYAYPYDDWHADYSTSRHTSLVFDIE